jgi:hypothetical protein
MRSVVDNWSTNQIKKSPMPTVHLLIPSPITLEELEPLKRTVSFTDADAAYLRRVGGVLAGRRPRAARR